MSDENQKEVLTPELFSEHVLHNAKQLNITILESLGEAVEKFGVEDEDVRRFMTDYLFSRLTAECADARLLKGISRSVKVVR